ncbi:MAG: FHA domain-containing protein [Planctomycetaceae bacterium]
MSTSADKTAISMDENDVLFVLMPVDQTSDLPALAVRQGVSTIGSTEDNTLVLNEEGIEPYHCSISVEETKVLIEAHGSQTQVNQNSIEKAELKVGDLLTLGSIEFSVVSNEVFLQNGSTASLVINTPAGTPSASDPENEPAIQLNLDELLSPEELFGASKGPADLDVPSLPDLDAIANLPEMDDTEDLHGVDEDLLASIMASPDLEEPEVPELEATFAEGTGFQVTSRLGLLEAITGKSNAEEKALAQ